MDNYDINLDSQFNQLIALITEIEKNETDFYKKALLKRIGLNVRATKNLLENSFLLDSCASIRISVDHCSRLYQYVHDPNSIASGNYKTAFQMLGRGPGTGYMFTALGAKADFGLLYSVLCSFVHPDLMALIIALSEDDKNVILLKVVISMGLIMSIFILLHTYTDYINDKIKNEVTNNAESIMNVFISAIISNATPENLLAINKIPDIHKLFANQVIGSHFEEFLTVIKQDPHKILELIGNIEI